MSTDKSFNLWMIITKMTDFDLAVRIKESIQVNSVFYNFIRKLKGAYQARKKGVMHSKVDFTTTDKRVANMELKRLYSNNLKGFKNRVQKLINYTKEMDAEPIFIT